MRGAHERRTGVGGDDRESSRPESLREEAVAAAQVERVAKVALHEIETVEQFLRRHPMEVIRVRELPGGAVAAKAAKAAVEGNIGGRGQACAGGRPGGKGRAAGREGWCADG